MSFDPPSFTEVTALCFACFPFPPISPVFPRFPPFFLGFGHLNFSGMDTIDPCAHVLTMKQRAPQ